MSRRFVFVPLAGSCTSDVWLEGPHVKAWGFLDEERSEFIPIYTEGGNECLPLMQPCGIFEAEIVQAIDIPENSTDLPDAVCIALAKLALLPVSRSNSND